MLHEFAVEPEAIAKDWESFRYVTEKFGVEQGRVVSRFPKRWSKKVVAAANAVDQNLGKRITEKLAHERFVVSFGRTYFDDASWIANALREDGRSEFAGIIAGGPCPEAPNRRTVPELDNNFFYCARQVVVRRDAQVLADTVHSLLACARQIVFVDPHFNPTRPKWRRTLAAFLRAATARGNRPSIIEYHIQWKDPGFADGRWHDRFVEACRDELPAVIPTGFNLRIVRWDDRNTPEQMHARYILTDRGGVSVENGLDEGSPGDTTDIGLLENQVWEQRLAQFQGQPAYRRVDDVVVGGQA
jgi:hypothetical protein